MDKFGKICRHRLKERLKISKITKFKSDLLQGNKDTDSQSRHILQTFMCCPPTIQTLDCKTVRIFAYSSTRAVKQKVSNEAENSERDWGETLKIFLLSQGV